MNFAEIRFWGLLAAGLLAIAATRWLARPWMEGREDAFDRASLCLLGLFLLGCVSLITVTIFVVVAVSSYLGLRWVLRQPPERHRSFLWILIPVQLWPLLYYKYADFVLNRVAGLEIAALRDLLIPVGISFYIFQMVGFVVDTLAFNKPLPRFLDFLNFASFFPQIVAGPIERREDLLPQMATFRYRISLVNLNAGLPWIVAGLFFKLCLADNMAQLFLGQSSTNPFLIWQDNLMFGLRIYYDFAGYSLVAVGLGRCFGVWLTLNFRSPYCSSSIAEFWRRWHVTLSQWFRDYVYVPLGGGRTRRWMFTVALVFVVSGIWHGAGWNFIIWGVLHGAFLILNRVAGPRLKLPSPAGWFLTNLAVFFAWLSFYETRTDVLWTKLKTLMLPTAYNAAAWREACASRTPADWLVTGSFLALAASVTLSEWRSLTSKDDPYRWLRLPAALALMIVLTVFLAPGKNNAFIYFAF